MAGGGLDTGGEGALLAGAGGFATGFGAGDRLTLSPLYPVVVSCLSPLLLLRDRSTGAGAVFWGGEYLLREDLRTGACSVCAGGE